MKTKYTISLVAIAAILGTTSFALAGDTSTFDASVSVLSPDQTGFIIGGQVAVNGVGTGALTLARSNASMLLTGSASSLLDRSTQTIGGGFGTATLGDLGILDGVTSTAQITSSLAFDRSITTSGALVGLGAVTSRGEAIAALGSAGAASANTTTAGTRANGGATSGGATPTTVTIDGGEGNASADASSQGSLNGSLSTSNTLQLLGTSGLFAGSNGMFVGEDNDAVAYGNSVVNADGTTGVALNNATTATTGNNLVGSGNGALFNVASSLTGAQRGTTGTINMTVANAGNGSISLTTSTGGFFTGGGAAAGSSSLADTTGSFFSPAYTVTP
jgi:hypothetical protein